MKFKFLPIFFFLFSSVYGQSFITKNIQIARDHFGIPHIFAPTDAEAAYGLAWAHSEDDFQHIQENLLAAQGHLAEVTGKEGALFDYLVQFMGIDTLVDKLYATSFTEPFKKVLEGYAAGFNAYAAAHPKEVLLKRAFPTSAIDIIKGYTLNSSLMSGIGIALQAITRNQVEEYNNLNDGGKGSNAFAISPSRTADGKTWLAVNSHQPLEGRFAWYEAHVNSGEGWNIIGGLFPGGVSIFVGTTPTLGWAHTVNFNIWGDVHKLKLNPKNKMQYEYDGKWLNFGERKAKLKVKVAGIKLGIKKRILSTEYGPVLETKHGWYALRFPAYSEIRSAEQWFNMNKAKNWKEFEKAIKMEAIASFNIIYGDKDGNIFFQSGGHYPDRDPKLDWKQPITSASSKHKWTKLLPYEKKPATFNPECGFVYNANNSPLQCTGQNCNLDMLFPGLQTFGTNRGSRFAELLDAHKGTFSWDDFLKIKYDKSYSHSAQYMKRFSPMYALDATKYPDIADAIALLKKWDWSGEGSSREAGFAMVVHQNVAHKSGVPFGFLYVLEKPIPEETFVAAIREAKRFLIATQGRIDPKLEEISRHIRGNVNLPISGLPDVLRATNPELYNKKKGIFRNTGGDGYIQLVKYGKDGSIEINAINAYGASAHPDSKHYADQMELFVQEKTRPMTFDKAQILRDAERVYEPK
jgi:acyl-homoserine-lactone acylase